VSVGNAVPKEQQEESGCQANKVNKVQGVQLVNAVHQERLELQVVMANRVFKDDLVPQVRWEVQA